jgi:hypothetical protein
MTPEIQTPRIATVAGAQEVAGLLDQDIRAWIENWNENPRPYVWTKPAEQTLESISRYCQRINQTGH